METREAPKPATVFVCIAMPLGLLFVALTPPMQVADEGACVDLGEMTDQTIGKPTAAGFGLPCLADIEANLHQATFPRSALPTLPVIHPPVVRSTFLESE